MACYKPLAMNAIKITTPFTAKTVTILRTGNVVHISGILYTARDAAHRRLVETIAEGKPLPLPLENQIIYYVGPAPAKEGHVIGPAGPTTSGRVDPYTLPLLEQGVKGFIGKGYRSDTVKAALIEYQAVYMAAVGGAAALLARHITATEVIAYADLETEAIRRLTVVDFPVIVVNDCFGGDAYQTGRVQYQVREAHT